jgi:two-component system, NtrC family, sensor kinase
MARTDQTAGGRELAEALEAQTAASEILRLVREVGSTPQPVFEKIAAVTLGLLDAVSASVVLLEGELLQVAALATARGAPVAAQDVLPRPTGRDTAAGRAIASQGVVAIPDVLADPDPLLDAPAAGVRSVVSVPLMRAGAALGAITVGRTEPAPFSGRQIALLQTFADQAAIAMVNARLQKVVEARNRELAEAVEQQQATSEILRVISRSPTEVPFDKIVAAAKRLCGASAANMFTFDGELLHVAALAMDSREGAATLHRHFPRPPSRGMAASRAVLTRRLVAIHDTKADAEYEWSTAEKWGFRSTLGVPLMREGTPIGAITIGRPNPGPFPENQVALLQTFADQAVIALENVRLFREVEARNRELAEAVEEQRATSEILRGISQSPDDAQPVFATIVARATQLCDASAACAMLHDQGRLSLAVRTGCTPQFAEYLGRGIPVTPETTSGRAALAREATQILDLLAEPGAHPAPAHPSEGVRTVLAVPVLRDDRLLGVLSVWRREVRAFTPRQIALLKTFADQAAIAIENVRLFRELAARTAQLERSVEGLRALSEVGQAVSSTIDLETVLRTIVSRATQLARMDGGAIYEYEEGRQEFRLHAADRWPDELVEALRSNPVPRGEGAVGRLATTGEPVAIGDIAVEGAYQSRLREILLRSSFRALLAVPLLREERLLGGLVVNRKSPGEFEPEVIDLLRTFATQSALAIQNARLYREIEGKSRQLEVASRHKSAFLANMSHELRTPLNAIIGFTRIVMRRSQDRLEPKQYQNLEGILASAQNLLSIINAILDLAKVEAGRTEVVPTQVRLAALLEQCMRTVEPLIREGVTQIKAFGGDLPPMIVDEEKLRQIVINLLSNAAKFTSRGSIEVRARAEDGSVELAVADTGIGIAADKLDLVFEEFEQAHAGTAREHGGTGLGLAIARRLARLLEGDLRVESAPGAGSTFTLTLPLRYGSRSP